MPASTQILQFDSTLQNLQPQANYAGSTIQLDGFSAGIVDPTVLNIILQQSSFMASGLANWMVSQGISVPNDGNMANLVNEISEALAAFVTGGGTGPVGFIQIYAGNPNGNVAGSVGVAGVSAPTFCWSPTELALWVCTTTGNAASAVWTEIGENTPWPYWCGTSTGSANAQAVTPPTAMQSFPTGTAVSFIAGQTNTGDTTLAVGSFATPHFRKDGPSGPIALTGGEIVTGNLISARYDGTYLHLTATEMGTAALANASSSTGIVAAVTGSGSLTAGHLAVFSDAIGTVADGGPPNAAGAPGYVNSNTTIGLGQWLVDTSAGPVTLTLPLSPTVGASVEFIDASGTWNKNPLTLANNGHTIMGLSQNLIANISGEVFGLWFNASSDWRLL